MYAVIGRTGLNWNAGRMEWSGGTYRRRERLSQKSSHSQQHNSVTVMCSKCTGRTL